MYVLQYLPYIMSLLVSKCMIKFMYTHVFLIVNTFGKWL
jgi:hypothetical protein